MSDKLTQAVKILEANGMSLVNARTFVYLILECAKDEAKEEIGRHAEEKRRETPRARRWVLPEDADPTPAPPTWTETVETGPVDSVSSSNPCRWLAYKHTFPGDGKVVPVLTCTRHKSSVFRCETCPDWGKTTKVTVGPPLASQGKGEAPVSASPEPTEPPAPPDVARCPYTQPMAVMDRAPYVVCSLPMGTSDGARVAPGTVAPPPASPARPGASPLPSRPRPPVRAPPARGRGRGTNC